MTKATETIHATAIQLSGAGVLIRGASGSGKSSIALRLLDEANLAGQAKFLIADDRVILENSGGSLFAHAPQSIFGMIEIRGIGVIEYPARQSSEIHLVVDLTPPEELERMLEPAQRFTALNGVKTPRITIAERNVDACSIIRTMLNLHKHDHSPTHIPV